MGITLLGCLHRLRRLAAAARPVDPATPLMLGTRCCLCWLPGNSARPAGEESAAAEQSASGERRASAASARRVRGHMRASQAAHACIAAGPCRHARIMLRMLQ